MEAVISHSQRICPFLRKTSPSALRTLSTSVAHSTSAGGGKMSNLQVLGRRCPVMGNALATQTAKMSGAAALSGAFGGSRGYHSKVPRANLHTQGPQKAQHAESLLRPHEQGTFHFTSFHIFGFYRNIKVNIILKFPSPISATIDQDCGAEDSAVSNWCSTATGDPEVRLPWILPDRARQEAQGQVLPLLQ